MKLMLYTSLVGLLVVAGACHNQTLRKSEESHDQWRVGKDGLFVGKATGTPLGDIGYALTFRTQEGRIIAKTLPTPKGAGLPDGAYQKFTFYSDAGGLRLDVETRLTDTTVRRTLIEDASRHRSDRWVLCDREAGCKRMEAILDWRTEGRLSWQTNMHGQLHSDMALARRKSSK